jgi:hypothetical protein
LFAIAVAPSTNVSSLWILLTATSVVPDKAGQAVAAVSEGDVLEEPESVLCRAAAEEASEQGTHVSRGIIAPKVPALALCEPLAFDVASLFEADSELFDVACAPRLSPD